MINTLNRRTLLSGATLLPALALPALGKSLPVSADAALFDIIRQWEAGKRVESTMGAEHSALERLAQANEPTIPAALLQPIALPTGLFSPSYVRGWTEYDLEFFKPSNAKEMLAIKHNYEAARTAVWKDAEEGQERFDEIVSNNTDLIMQMAETPANTLQGLLAKCHVARNENLFTHFMDFSNFAQSLVEDIERIAPQFIGRA